MPDRVVLLQTVDLSKSFDMVQAAANVNVKLHEGELVGIVGANGSGKTTFLNLVTGYLTPDRGRIFFQGQDRTGLPPRAIVKLGIARSFQIPQLYTHMTVLENLLLSLAAQAGQGVHFWRPLYRAQWIEHAEETLGVKVGGTTADGPRPG